MQQGRGRGIAIDDDLPPGRRALTEGLRELHAQLVPPLLPVRRLAERLTTEKDPGWDSSGVYRYLSGKRVAPEAFIRKLYALAEKDAGGGADGLKPLQFFLDLLQGAERKRCGNCVRLRQEVRELQGGLAQAETETSVLRSKVDELHVQGAGLEKALFAARQQAAMHLPVPHPRGDRQVHAQDVAAAKQIARRAQELQDQGDQGAALALLRETTEVLTPAESAATLVLLREQQQKQLVETLIHIYGRDQPEDNVIRVALELHDYGLLDDAGAVLRAAVK
ncbi:hypothetical protein AB0F13_06410 [Streptomyces sp. NPDC026206]|uniref:hypothetical protein n=1 Tax=Streptomyces sp. NPDC026206 TaxID=3157089 RepID=UPI0033D3E02C